MKNLEVHNVHDLTEDKKLEVIDQIQSQLMKKIQYQMHLQSIQTSHATD